MRGVDDRSSARFTRPLPDAPPANRIGPRAPGPAPIAKPPAPTPQAPDVARTEAGDRARILAQSGTVSPLIATFVADTGFAARIDDVRAGRAGVSLEDKASVRAQLQGLGAAELSALRDALVLKPPHPELKKMRGHPAISGRPSLEGVLSILAGEPLGVAATRTARVRSHTQLEAASPAPSLLAPGTAVRVRRSNGALDEGWTIRSRTPGGDVIVAKPELGALKQVSASSLLGDNLALIAPGTPVQIRRSSGALEAGWQVLGAGGSADQVRVTNARGDAKDVPLETLLGLNPPLLGTAPAAGLADRVFAPMSPVTVRRSSGAQDPGWKVIGFDPAERRVRVMAEGMSKSVDARELLTDNPGLVPAGTPLIIPRPLGPPERGWTATASGPDGIDARGPGGETARIGVAELLALNPQLVDGAPAPLRSGGLARVSGEARAQSESFNASHVIPAGQRILDGYVDGGRSAQILPDGGEVVAAREVLVVDRARDPRLQEHLAFARGLRDLPPHPRAKALVDYVANLFTPPDRDAIRAANEVDRRFESREVLLGEVPDLTGGGACRHRALMLKVLGDEANLDVALQRGNAVFGETRGAHAWNVVVIDGAPYLADPMNPTRSYGAAQLPRLDAPGLREAYVDVAWKPLYGSGPPSPGSGGAT